MTARDLFRRLDPAGPILPGMPDNSVAPNSAILRYRLIVAVEVVYGRSRFGPLGPVCTFLYVLLAQPMLHGLNRRAL